MRHIQAFITPGSLVPMLKQLREVPAMPELNVKHQRDGSGREEVVLCADLPDEILARVVGIIRAHSDCLVIVTPDKWMDNYDNQNDFLRVVEVLPERFNGALHGRADNDSGARLPTRRTGREPDS